MAFSDQQLARQSKVKQSIPSIYKPMIGLGANPAFNNFANGKSAMIAKTSGTQSVQVLPPKDGGLGANCSSMAGGSALSSLTAGCGVNNQSASQSKLVQPQHSINMNSGAAFMQQQNFMKNQVIRSNVSNIDTVNLLANLNRQTSQQTLPNHQQRHELNNLSNPNKTTEGEYEFKDHRNK